MDTAINGSESLGIILAAAIVPMPLTAISSFSVKLIGETCLNQSTSTRSDSFTTIDQRLCKFGNFPLNQHEFHTWESQCSREPVLTPVISLANPLPTSCNNATSASICKRRSHASHLVAMFQLTTLIMVAFSKVFPRGRAACIEVYGQRRRANGRGNDQFRVCTLLLEGVPTQHSACLPAPAPPTVSSGQ